MSNPLVVDVFSDLVCPWCFIGKRRLERAIEKFGRPVAVRYHAYQLAPELPPEGVDARGYFEAKFGGAERMKAIFDRVAEAGKPDGILFDFHAQTRSPNTRLAHRVVRFAEEQGLGAKVCEALFSGHFLEGADLARIDSICALLDRHGTGIDTAQLRSALDAGGFDAEVNADLQFAREAGIRGVPFFIADGRLAMSGAQEIDAFVGFLEKAAQA